MENSLLVKENKALSSVIENVYDFISLEVDALVEVDKLNYSLCITKEEKINYTKKQIKKLQHDIKNCNPILVSYLNALMNNFENIDEEDTCIKRITSNFIYQVLDDFSFQLHMNEDFFVNEDEDFLLNNIDKLITCYYMHGFDISILKDYVKYVALVKCFLYKKEILKNYSIQSEETKTIEENKKELKHDFKSEVSFKKNTGTKLNVKNSLIEIAGETKYNYILKMLDDLAITKEGKYNMSPKKKSAIRGVAQALLDNNILPAYSINKLCIYFASLINLKLASKLQKTTTYKDYLKKANKYILENKL
jgi:hypothetical protein